MMLIPPIELLTDRSVYEIGYIKNKIKLTEGGDNTTENTIISYL
jgi:hypothetical protein